MAAYISVSHLQAARLKFKRMNLGHIKTEIGLGLIARALRRAVIDKTDYRPTIIKAINPRPISVLIWQAVSDSH